MSGGYFNYQRIHLEEIAEEIEEIISTNECKEIDTYGDAVGRFYPREIIEKLQSTAKDLRRLYKQVKHIDYLLSRDYGEDTFLESWEQEEQ